MEKFSEQFNEKENKLNELRSRLERTVDGLGKRIDSGILDTVLYFNALEIPTNGSCEGHLNRGLPYSWVTIGAVSESSDLYKQHLKEERDFDEIPDSDDIEKKRAFNQSQFEKYGELLGKIKQEKEEKRQEIQKLLDGFYKKNLDLLPYKLSRGLRLLPANVPEFHISKWVETLSLEEKEELLIKSQESMNKFTEYLKDLYFR